MHRFDRGQGAAVPQGPGEGLGHGGVCDAAEVDAHEDPEGIGHGKSRRKDA